MHSSISALALLSLLTSARAAAIPRRPPPAAEAVVQILPDGTAGAPALLPDDTLLANVIVARDGSNPLPGILSLVYGLLDGLAPVLGADAVNTTEGVLNTLAGLLLIENPTADPSSGEAEYVMSASTNRSTPLFLVSAANDSSADAGTPDGKTLVTIHVPILDQTMGNMVDSCLTYDQDPTQSSTLAAQPCAPDTDHASQKFMYDRASGVVEPMFSGADAMDLATQTPSYMVNAANVDTGDAPAANASSVLIVFTPATDSVSMYTAALPLSKVETSTSNAAGTSMAEGGSASASASGMSASASTDGSDASLDPSTDGLNANHGQSTLVGGEMPTDIATAKKNTGNSDEECKREWVEDEST